jgi:hypothetical protein
VTQVGEVENYTDAIMQPVSQTQSDKDDEKWRGWPAHAILGGEGFQKSHVNLLNLPGTETIDHALGIAPWARYDLL